MSQETPEDTMGRKEPSGGQPNAEGNATLKQRGGIMEKLAVLEGDGWLTNYDAKPLGPFTYAVLSLNDGMPSQHVVNLHERSCTCEDKTYNVDRAAGMCRHQLYCLVREDSPEERDTALLAVVAHGSQVLADTARELRAHTTAKEADAAVSSTSAGPDPTEAMETLEEAFEDADAFNLKDVDTGEYEGDAQVWFKLGADDFDELKAITSGNDLVGYNGEWNTVKVEDVDTYISEVLG